MSKKINGFIHEQEILYSIVDIAMNTSIMNTKHVRNQIAVRTRWVFFFLRKLGKHNFGW